MSEENLNKNSDWAERLSALEALPGEEISRTDLWEKLEVRLVKKKKRVVPIWYWPAAAVFILAIALPVFFKYKNNPVAVNTNNPARKESGLTPRPRYFPAKENDLNRLTVEGGKDDQVTFSKVKKREGKLKVKIPSPVKMDSLPGDNIQVAVTVPDSILQRTALVKPAVGAPALRVIHINEIEHPADQKEIMARNGTPENDKPGSSRQPNGSRFILTNNATDNFLKINLSPSN